MNAKLTRVALNCRPRWPAVGADPPAGACLQTHRVNSSAEALAFLDSLHNCLPGTFWMIGHVELHRFPVNSHFFPLVYPYQYFRQITLWLFPDLPISLLIDFHFPAPSMCMLGQISITTPFFPYILKETVSLTESWLVSVNEHKTVFT